MRGRVLVDNLAAALPDHAQRSAVIGRTLVGNLFVNTGHGPLGWTLVAGSARLPRSQGEPVDAGVKLPKTAV